MGQSSDVTRAQHAIWASRNFHRIGVSQLVVGELLVRALHVHAGEQVLDVAGGAGNTALAAARRWADVTCTDYVPDQLSHAAERAAAEGLPLRTELADANWTPDSWVGEQFALQAAYRPPPAGVTPPSAWGTRDRLDHVLAGRVSGLETSVSYTDFVHHTTTSLCELFKEWFGP